MTSLDLTFVPSVHNIVLAVNAPRTGVMFDAVIVETVILEEVGLARKVVTEESIPVIV